MESSRVWRGLEDTGAEAVRMIRRVGNAEGSGLRLSLTLRQVGERATRASKTRTYQAPWKPNLSELHERLEATIEEYYRTPPAAPKLTAVK